MNTEHTDIIPINKETRRRKRLFPLLFITVLLLAILVAVFIYGVIIGGKYAVKINNIDPDSIPITEYIVNGLRDLGKISFSTTLEEKEINPIRSLEGKRLFR